LKFSGLHLDIFRFSVEEIFLLIAKLQIPEDMTFNGYRTTATEAFCILLYRMGSKCRYVDMIQMFDRSKKFICQVFLGMSVWLFANWGHLVRTFRQSWTTGRHWLDTYAAAVEARGSPLPDLVGWCDGTFIPVARPSRNQRASYCGHRGCHCIKSQVLGYPCGLVTAFGPFPGPTHDSSAAQQLQLDQMMVEHCSFEDRSFVIFLDQAYGLGQATITPFRGRGRQLTADEHEFNRLCSQDRVSVEHLIGLIKNTWPSLTVLSRMALHRSPVAIFWFNAVLLTNLRTILRGGNQVSERYAISPPTIDEYLSLPNPEH